MKTLRQFSQVCLLSLGALGATAYAQEFKIGFVNTDRIFREASTAKTAQVKLEQEFSKREKELVDFNNTLKTASDKFEREAPTLSESQRAARQKQLMEQDREFQRKRREFQEDLNTRKNEEQQLVIERANLAVAASRKIRSVLTKPILNSCALTTLAAKAPTANKQTCEK